MLNRGFGGALIDDVVRYADRIVVPYHPKAIVLFAGTNDVSGRRPASPQHVADGFARFVSLVRTTLPDPALYRSDGLHPSPHGYAVWASRIKAALDAGMALAAPA